MDLLEILPIAFALSLDAFAVSLAAAASGKAAGRRAAFRLSFHFGLFQFLMPILGWALGSTFAPLIGRYDHWVAFTLLVLVAARMIQSGFGPVEDRRLGDPSRGWILIMLATATSIDALAVGLSLATLGVSVWYPSVVIGVVTAGMCVGAIAGARYLKKELGTRSQIAGGVILLLVAIRILATHLG